MLRSHLMEFQIHGRNNLKIGFMSFCRRSSPVNQKSDLFVRERVASGGKPQQGEGTAREAMVTAAGARSAGLGG